MKVSRLQLCIAALLALTSVAYAFYKIGHIAASREGIRTLAFVSLWTVKPSIQLVDHLTSTSTDVPASISNTAASAIYMVARYSMLFDPSLAGLDQDSKSALCAMAKNADLYHQRQPKLYDDDLVAHLRKMHARLSSEGVVCSV